MQVGGLQVWSIPLLIAIHYIYIYIITLQMTYDKTMHENKSYKNEHFKSAEKLTDFIDALKEGKEVKSLTLVGRWFQASTLL
jgi:hypothetical protein